jgi:hypothetical protein
MVTVHKALIARLHTDQPDAVLLATPYGFQENADDVSARAQAYFARSVGLDVRVIGDGDSGGPAAVRAADWLFAGPGSPSYALARWRGDPIADALRERVSAGAGVTVLASAAAATMGVAALPVYEIYKAGVAPHWLDGLDLLGVLGIKAAVIPHYDNAEGGNHDTRYCYLGERRLALLERELPADAAVLGVDEHTAAILDLRAGTLEVSGRGGVTVRRAGASTVLPAGTVLALARLRELIRGAVPAVPGDLARPRPARARDAAAPVPAGTVPAGTAPAGTAPGDPPPTLTEITDAAQRRFDAAVAGRDAAGLVRAILDLEAAVHAWAADTDEDQGTEQARTVLRGLVARLGRAAHEGLRDPRERLTALVEPLLRLRAQLRGEGRYPAADAIRDALTAAGVRIEDTADGTRWEPPAPGHDVTPDQTGDR